MKGSTYRRCYCRGEDGKPLGKSCPQLSSRRHGVYAIRQELPARADGTRRSFSRGGYGSAKDAQEALDQVRALLAVPDGDDTEGQVAVGDLLEKVSKDSKAPLPDLAETRRRLTRGQKLTATLTVGDLLDEWLEVKRKSRRRTTLNGYESHVRVHLRPHLAERRLDRLTVGHVQAMFDAIDEQNETIAAENQRRREQEELCRWTKPGRPPAAERAKLAEQRAALAELPPYRRITGQATKHAVRRTLRTALNFAIGREYITFNPAKHVELGAAKRATGLLWTAERVARWRETGEKPSPVMVWTPDQLGEFLDAAEGDELYALFHLIAYHGLRRGEGVGQAWADIDFQTRTLTVAKAITVDGWTPYEDEPKTADSAGIVRLDSGTVAVLQAHRAQQLQARAERLQAGLPWTDTGKVFTQDDGTWLHPETVSDAFRRIVAEADLPPINLRDLRHGAAALIKAAGGDLQDAKEKLRHSTIVLTADTYMPLFAETEQELTERAAAVVPRARRQAPSDTAAHASLTHEPEDDEGPRPS
ncbi:site-specific integrase [Streptomyces sp. AC563]|uniref:site-specific integrase n=1 Tax=Streptomyces buecherae TaxID=2763006 RepID=UPI00164D9A3E|nr:tyrosine-type recombinase/integrase [Streptomyces buecherae]MBC3988022.1 site-specific integrase [Streptomyces buecherae]